jgi:hypothetical protein
VISTKTNMRFQSELFTSKHYDQVMNVFIHSFCDSEPMTKYVNMEYAAFQPFAELVATKAVEDQMSAVVVEKKTGRVVALTLVEDLADAGPLPFPVTPKFDPILGLLEALSKDYFEQHPFAPKTIAHLFITAVDATYRGNGLSRQANFYAMKLAYEKGFQLMTSELTNYINEKGLVPYLKGKKELIGAITYRDFQLNGEYPFKHLEGAAHSYLWDLRENNESF